MIEIFLFEKLVSFSKNGTLSAAAEELHISQPALSRSMKKLEEAFGVPLFDRSKSKISLNETGKVAAQYAQRVLLADREMMERVAEFDRSRRTVSFGACAALPANTLMPFLQEYFSGMAITSEIASEEQLLSGLRNHTYHLAILHERPDGSDLFCQQYMDEHLSVALPIGHALATQKSLSFRDLSGISILAHGSAGFWLDICRQNLTGARLLVQDSMDVLSELVDASSLPAFSSDRAAEHGHQSAGRVTIPISDKAAYATYHLVCLRSERVNYSALFSAAQSVARRRK